MSMHMVVAAVAEGGILGNFKSASDFTDSLGPVLKDF